MTGQGMGFSVEAELLAATGTAMNARHSELSGELDQLTAASNAMSGQWSGAAQQAFLSRYAGWSSTMRHLDAVLQSAGDAARQAAESYRQADERVAALWEI